MPGTQLVMELASATADSSAFRSAGLSAKIKPIPPISADFSRLEFFLRIPAGWNLSSEFQPAVFRRINSRRLECDFSMSVGISEDPPRNSAGAPAGWSEGSARNRFKIDKYIAFTVCTMTLCPAYEVARDERHTDRHTYHYPYNA